MKKVRSLFILFLIISLLASMFSCAKNADNEEVEEVDDEEETIEIDMSKYEYVDNPYAGSTLTVYNWGEYISDGSEGSVDIIELFEAKYGIHVIYSTYASNEDLYAKLKSGGIAYDVICPSEYMIGKLIEENMLEKIDMSHLSNYDEVDDQYKGLFFDPTNEYSVPYTIGTLGIIYNSTLVDEEDVVDQSWDLMWNEKYQGMILTFDNARDAFGIAQFRKHMNVNSTDLSDWDLAQKDLLEQQKVLQGYVMDEIFQAMEGGNAAIAAYYAGDCISMMGENEDLVFYYPKEGTNLFCDGWCIPKGAPNKGAAELFIDFMCDPDIATYNANYICYASPVTAVLTNDAYDYPEGTDEYDILYGFMDVYEEEDLQYYHTMPTNVIEHYNKLFDEVKAGFSNDAFYVAIFPVTMVGIIALVVTLVILDKKKKLYHK